MAPHSPQTKSAVISFSNTGDNTVIAGISGIALKVYGLTFTVTGATDVTYKDSVAGAFSGAMRLVGNGSSMTLPMSDEPWFMTRAGSDFVLNQTNSVTFGGILWYTT